MTTVKILNNEQNREHLRMNGHSFQVSGKYLVVTPNAWHQSYLSTGQMSVASYKKKVLGL